MKKAVVLIVLFSIAVLLLCIAIFAQQKGSFTDERDGKKYRTVKIGEQVWMAEDLKYATGCSKYYDNNSANCQEYERVYDWETAMKVCPSGWHLPSDEEWQELVDFAGGDKVAGQKLKAKSLLDGTDDYGFSALTYYKGITDCFGNRENWWTATENNASSAYLRFIFQSYAEVNRKSYDKGDLNLVRCVRD
jgi:uncharacterized protein (TIGR02145 family)